MMGLKIWRIWQEVNRGYDTYDSAVVVAESEEQARNTVFWFTNPPTPVYAGIDLRDREWCQPEHVQAECIGEARDGLQAGVIVASFNAG